MTAENRSMYTLLVLDDEPAIVHAMTRILKRMPQEWLREPCTLKTFTDPLKALQSLADVPYDLIISDLRMPGMDGLTFLRQALEFQPEALRMVVSGHADRDAVLSAMNDTRVFRFVEKPWDDSELQLAVVHALQTSALMHENQRLADLVRMQRGTISRQEAVLRELESECPGITQLQRDETGAIYLDENDV